MTRIALLIVLAGGLAACMSNDRVPVNDGDTVPINDELNTPTQGFEVNN